MIKLPHIRIARFTPTKIGTNITLEILQEDLPRSTRDILEQLWKDGNSLAGAFQEVREDPEEVQEETIGSLVSKLHYLMQQYCKKESMNFDTYNNDFKKRYHVHHKNEIDRTNILKEIERHKA